MAYVLPQAPVPIERTILEANMGGDKKPSFEYFQQGHGKTVIAETTLTEAAIERVLRTHGSRPRGARLGRDARRRRVGDAVGRVHSGVGGRGGLRGHQSGPRARRHELDGPRDGAAVEGGLHVSIRFPGIEVGTVGGGTTLPIQALARAHGLRRPGQGLPPRAAGGGDGARAGDQRLGSHGDGGQRELLPRALRARREVQGWALLAAGARQAKQDRPATKQIAPTTAQKVLPVIDEPWMSVVP